MISKFSKNSFSTPLKNPKILFLVDGFGALLSAFFLAVLLVKFEKFVGLPASSLHFLAGFPILFAVYDFYYYFKLVENWAYYLKGIAIMNCLYCLLSLGVAFYHSDTILFWGWAYFSIEIALILLLVYVELKVARMVKNY